IGRFKKAFQQQYGLGNTACTQAESFFETGNTKGVGIGERSRGLKKTVSVSVRFHDCNELAGGCQFTQALQVVSQSAAVNNNSCRLHVNSLFVVVLRSRIVIKARPLAVKGQTYRTDWAVTLLTDNDFGDPFQVAVLVINLITVDEHD